MAVVQSLLYFVLAGLCEIGGGYLIWLWLREGKSFWLAVGGAIVLALYGIIPTLQPANFGRVYAAYGGVFVVMALIWGWQVDRVVPDRFDWLGVAVVLLGVLVMMYAPRS
ncbi:MAG: YnfA family protein [Cyanosarcina radialis HA8281-LM2]|nr:YnfA family protein [Cyanosarcina radialis HA8281-LM2]